jgi:ABC-type multidrug transport system permease subunit
VLAATLTGQPVRCAPSEAAYFSPPAGQTCGDFAGAFVREAGRGYLMNPNATADCGYCPYATGDEYLATLGISPDTKWRNFGIFLVFCFTNWL